MELLRYDEQCRDWWVIWEWLYARDWVISRLLWRRWCILKKIVYGIGKPRLNFHVPRLVEGLLTIRSKVAKGLRAQIPAVHTHFCFQSLKTYLDETEFSRFEIFSRGVNFCPTSTDKCTQCQRHCVSRSFLWNKKDSESVAGWFKLIFSCPGQLNRWPCHSLSEWETFDRAEQSRGIVYSRS